MDVFKPGVRMYSNFNIQLNVVKYEPFGTMINIMVVSCKGECL
jgi:hypothetical protein